MNKFLIRVLNIFEVNFLLVLYTKKKVFNKKFQVLSFFFIQILYKISI